MLQEVFCSCTALTNYSRNVSCRAISKSARPVRSDKCKNKTILKFEI